MLLHLKNSMLSHEVYTRCYIEIPCFLMRLYMLLHVKSTCCLIRVIHGVT